MNHNNTGSSMVPSYVQNSVAAQRAHAAAQAAAGYTYPQQSVSVVAPHPIAPPTTAVAAAPITSTATTVSNSALHSAPGNNNSKISLSSTTANYNQSGNSHDVLLWQLDLQGIERWIRSTHALFPKKPRLRIDPATGNVVSNQARPIPTTAEQIQADANFRSEQQNLQQTEQNEYNAKTAIANQLLINLLNAIQKASSRGNPNDSETATDQPPTKRIKVDTEVTDQKGNDTTNDTFFILDPSFAKGKEIVHLPGAIISRLTVGGLINAMAGVPGGLVDPLHSKLLAANYDDQKPIPTAANISLKTLRNVYTRSLHRALSARLEMDMMDSTPARIAEMLCPEVTLAEVNNIRKRIYETVILGKGTNASDRAAGLEGTEDLPVAARVGMHDIDKWKKCKVCNNNDQSSFVLDRKNGDLICTICGTIAMESLMHEGSQFRKFEGELDRNHHGDAPNPLYSNAHNMSTTLGGVSVQTGAGMGGFGSGKKQNLENILRNVHDYTEMNISQFGKDEKKTRVGYKDRQKKDAFVKMTHVGDALSLHEAVVQRAKELFAGFRDDRELVQQFKGVVAACLCEAFDQLSKDGKQILKLNAGEDDWDDEDTDGKKKDNPDAYDKFNKRASKRSELHSSNMAGKGGLILNAPAKLIEEQAKQNQATTANGTNTASTSTIESKTASSWDLDDCRSWLLEASRSIAKIWADKQQDDLETQNVPKGTLNELEGKLVEHTLELCNMLESELNSSCGNNGVLSRQRVVTPRVREMGRLGIRWQHAHERGSGGAGGVGNNAMSAAKSKGTKKCAAGGRTAGQILILKTARKLSEAIKDPVAGEAFHKELRAVLNRQEDRKKKELRDEAALQRFRQMQRKPWLKARLENKR